MERRVGIYMFTNNLKKNYLGEPLRYIGQSTNIDDRYKDHKGRYGTNPMYEDFQKLGFENFSFEVLIECSKEELDEVEIKFIKDYNTVYPNGYNLTKGGSGYPNDFTELTLERLRVANVGENNPMFGTNSERLKERNPMFNRRQSDEARRKIAERSKPETNAVARKIEDKSGRIWLTVMECSKFFDVYSSHLSAIIKGTRKVYHYLEHLDLHYLDDRPENYEFVPLEELEKIAKPKKVKNFKVPLKESSKCSKQVIDSFGKIYSSVKECCRQLNYSSSLINSCLLGDRHFPKEIEHYGLKFLNEEFNQLRYEKEKYRRGISEINLPNDIYKINKNKTERVRIIDFFGNVFESIEECAFLYEVPEKKLKKMLAGAILFSEKLKDKNLRYL